ncbi:hypothetical protein HBI70_199480 [Parastagonospora nodorum]|nr:hypothetical protein HBI70_199480 [Parastagonospora nodorum]
MACFCNPYQSDHSHSQTLLLGRIPSPLLLLLLLLLLHPSKPMHAHAKLPILRIYTL